MLVVRGSRRGRPHLPHPPRRRHDGRRGRGAHPRRRGHRAHRRRAHPGVVADPGRGGRPGRPRRRVRRADRARRRPRLVAARRHRRPRPGQRGGPEHPGLAGRPAAGPRRRSTAPARGGAPGCSCCRGWRSSRRSCSRPRPCGSAGRSRSMAEPDTPAHPSGGRRRVAEAARRRPSPLTLLAVAVPLLTVAALAIVRPAETPPTSFAPTSAPLDRATAVCPARLPGADDLRLGSTGLGSGDLALRVGRDGRTRPPSTPAPARVTERESVVVNGSARPRRRPRRHPVGRRVGGGLRPARPGAVVHRRRAPRPSTPRPSPWSTPTRARRSPT